MRTFIMTSILFLSISSSALPIGGTDHIIVKPDDIIWADAPNSLPSGAKVAILMGNPAVPGPFVLRIKMPADYKIPLHFHPQDETITILSGTLYLGMSNDDQESMDALPAGSFARMPPKMPHYVRTEHEVVVQLNGVGPWGITYVNPEDDPRKQK